MVNKNKFVITPASLTAALAGDFENAMIAATPGGIEAQERAGQTATNKMEVLPKDCPKAQLEEVGVVFGKDQDDLFVKVTLPVGWSKRATDHAMWSDLLDDKQRKRGAIFYKAASYDRSAHMTMNCRYAVDSYYGCDKDGTHVTEYSKITHFRTVVKDGETVIHTVDSKLRPKAYSKESYEQQSLDSAKACHWLDANFIDWRDVNAYWDRET